MTEEHSFEPYNQEQPKELLLTEQSATDFCSRHPDKKAKYSISSVGEKKFEKLCSKCALKEALKEGKVDLDLSFHEKFKRDGLENLITNLERSKLRNNLMRANLKEKMNYLETNYSQQITSFNNIFTRILRLVNEVQNEAQAKLDKTMLLTKTKIQNYLNALSDNQNKIDKILSDISGNYQNIITEMKIEAFKDVAQLYENKNMEIMECVRKISNENFEYIIMEENVKQMQNFKKMDVEKLFSIFPKTTFLDTYHKEFQPPSRNSSKRLFEDKNESSTECTSVKKSSLSKTCSVHEDSKRALQSNPSYEGLTINAKENSVWKSNQTSRQKISTAEKMLKREKNNSTVSIRTFSNYSHLEKTPKSPLLENMRKNFRTDRETQIRNFKK